MQHASTLPTPALPPGPTTGHSAQDYFLALAQVNNPSGEEAQMRAWIQARLQEMGLTDWDVDEIGNLLVRIPGVPGAETVMLSAHMDSVPPCHNIQPVLDTHPEDGRAIIRSAGDTILGGDDKAGIAVILAVVYQLVQQGFTQNVPLELLFSVQEEIGLLGLKAFDTGKLKSSYGYALDGDGPMGVVFHAGSTQQHFELVVQGKPAHAGINPQQGLNAIQVLAHTLTQVPQGRWDECTTLNVGTLKGGAANNVVAEWASVKGELRSRSPEALVAVQACVASAVQATQTQYPEAKLSLQWIPRYAQFYVPVDHPVVTRWQAVMAEAGLEGPCLPMSIGSDAHILNAQGYPTVVLGMGFYRSHSLGEFIEVEALATMPQLVLRLLKP